MNETTIILPSARAIRYELNGIESKTLFLPNYITMSEFISKLCIVKDFKILDDDSRVLLLLEASDFHSFSSLQIQRNFFTFTKNSSYIFKFFEELSAELYSIENLDSSDIYAEYEEHIEILKELYKRYENLCLEKKLLDRIFLPKLYQFNDNYISKHKKIELYIDGHLTNFEFELLEKCCEYTQLEIIFNTSVFNKKMQTKFKEIGIELEKNYEYKISLNDKTVISKIPRENHTNITCESFSESILQISYIKQKVYQFINKGYQAEKIAVILPNESIATLLKSFDEKSNFNFAMGEPFSTTKIYEQLNSTCKVIDQDSKENYARLKRVGDEIYVELLSIYHKKSSEVDFIEFLKKYAESFKSKIHIKIFNEELYSFEKILSFMGDMSVKSLIGLFLQRLAKRTIDDVRGGKITVMGVLETRMVEFDAVVIVDFSDSNVPKKSDKDMFLNTSIREIANLPTMSDRENLQKHYYQMLINRTKEVAISFVKSEQSSGSRFLKQLGILDKNSLNEEQYSNILFNKKSIEIKEDKEIVLDYSFKDVKLSASRLKIFLTCKRKYYHRYIEHIENHTIPKDMPQEWEVGINIHSALKELYTKRDFYDNADDLKRDLHRELDKACGDSELDKYLMSLQKRRMDDFCLNEIKRFKDGWRVESCEQYFERDFAGMKLIGQIDRIDKRVNEIEILDYKTGKINLNTSKNYTDATDFQLEFYYLLAGGLGNVVASGFYDLKESKIIPEAFLEEKLAVLESNIKDLLNIEEVNFEMCEDSKNCIYCEYKTMCER